MSLGTPSVNTLINSSNCIVLGNTSSGTALTVQQLGAGDVFAVSNTSGTGGLFVSASSNVGIGTTNPTSQLHVYSLSGVQNQTGKGAVQVVNCGGLPLNINYTGTGGALNYAIYSVSGSSSGLTVNKLFRYIGSVLSDGSAGNLGGLHVEGIIGGGGTGGNACYLKADFTNRGTSGGYKYSQLTGGTVDSTMNIFMVSNTSSTNYDLYIQYGNSGYNGFNLDIKSTWNTFNFINIEGTADPRTAPTSYTTSWDLLGTANFVQKGSNGNVGIGTTSPSGPLHVTCNSASDTIVSVFENLNTTVTTNKSFKLQFYGRDTNFTQKDLGAITLVPTDGNFGYSAMAFSIRGPFGAGSSEAVQEVMRFSRSGTTPCVGIGTTSPSYPLHVNGAVNLSTTFRYFNNGTVLTQVTSTCSPSIYASNDIAAGASIVAVSDRRAKILEEPPSEPYLNLVDKVQVRQFSWIDEVEKGATKKIGFFAQEVEKVLPDAVGKTTGVVPTIYREANAFTESTITVTNHGLTTEKKLEVVDLENGKTKVDIVNVIDADNLEVKFEKPVKDKLFVVGPEVDDSRLLNHDYLMAVGFGGLKELHALVKTQQTTIEMLTERLSALEAKLNSQ